MAKATLDDFKKHLQIDRNDLDTCLMMQPELYYGVSERLVHLTSERDSLKLHVEEETAAEDKRIREEAVRYEEKTTESSIQQKIKLVKSIQKLQQDLLDKRREVDEFQAMKEAFSQRSFMLRELVALVIAQHRDLALEGGGAQARSALAEKSKADQGALRRRRLLEVDKVRS